MGSFDFSKVFPNHIWPKTTPNSVNSASERGAGLRYHLMFKKPGLLTHENVKMLVISHTANSHTIARVVCRLCFNFLHASINWWCEPIEGRTDPPFTKKVLDFSYSLLFGVVGYYYLDYCNICVARPKFKVGYRHGKVVFGRLQKCYTDRELVSIYKDHPF